MEGEQSCSTAESVQGTALAGTAASVSFLDEFSQEPGSGSLSAHSSAAYIEVVLFCDFLQKDKFMLEPPAFPPLNPLADFSYNIVNSCYTFHFLPNISFWLGSDVFFPPNFRN